MSKYEVKASFTAEDGTEYNEGDTYPAPQDDYGKVVLAELVAYGLVQSATKTDKQKA